MIGFAHPIAFILIAPAVAVILYLYWRSRRSLLFIEAHSAPERRAGLTVLNRRSHALLFFWYVLMSLLVIVAVASPYSQGEGAVSKASGRMLIFIDASLSMQARDITRDGNSVTRLEIAKDIARHIIFKASETGLNLRTGLYSFAGTVVVHSPPSDDREAVLSVLDSLGTTSYANTGSSLAAVLAAIRSQASYAAPGETFQAVLIGDGEIPPGYEDQYDEDLDALEAAGIAVHAITVGHDVPMTITLYDPAELIRNPGERIKPLGTAETAREDEHYERIADATDARFASVETVAAIDEVVAPVVRGLAAKAGEAGIADPEARRDLTPYIMGFFALLLAIDSIGLSILRERRMAFLLLPFMLSSLLQCDRWTSHMYNEKGILLERIDAAQAREQYERARLYSSGAGTASANLGSLSGDEKDYAAAHDLFETSIRVQYDRPAVHYEDGRLLVLWALQEAEECRLDRAKELLDVSSQRFETAVSLLKDRGAIRRFYERHLLHEPDVESRAMASLDLLTEQRQKIGAMQKKCPPPEKDPKSQDDKDNSGKDQDPNSSKKNPPEKNPEKKPESEQEPEHQSEKNENENENKNSEPEKNPGVRGSVKPADEVTARLEQLKGQNRGEFRQSRQQQGREEEGQESQPGKPTEGSGGRPIWW